jgi:regulator of protease activity HflC (stomatin/prohibitin superfamily)
MTQKQPYVERTFQPISGWPMVALWFGLLALLFWIVMGNGPQDTLGVAAIALTVLAAIVLPIGFFIVNPNVSRVMVLFGRYRGTVRSEGFHWTNPFTIKKKVSLRAHNLASKTIKVNDLLGNPIEIGAVIVWRVKDTAQASFDVEKYEEYVDVQTEAAIRNLAQHHPYDDALADTDVPTLRGDTETVAAKLTTELQNRFERAGIEVIEARLSHLAYASEIASAMLQRQQAAAVIAARKLIVEGAVGIVEHALQDLGHKRVVELDDERRATLVGNLLVVLCGHSAPTPILNAGTLYN